MKSEEQVKVKLDYIKRKIGEFEESDLRHIVFTLEGYLEALEWVLR